MHERLESAAQLPLPEKQKARTTTASPATVSLRMNPLLQVFVMNAAAGFVN